MKRSIAALLLLAATTAYAVEWTQQPGSYNLYLSGTENKYITVNPVDIKIPASYKIQPGVYIQCLSTGNSKRYLPQGYDCNTRKALAVKCEGYVCYDPQFGWTFDLTKNSVMMCPKVKIEKGVAISYDGVKSVAGQPVCPK